MTPTVAYVVDFENWQWTVRESGFAKPIASFSRKQDAVSYAQKLAQTKENATVEVKT